MQKPKYCKDCKYFHFFGNYCGLEKKEYDSTTGITRIRIVRRNPDDFNINNDCEMFKKERMDGLKLVLIAFLIFFVVCFFIVMLK